MTQEALKMALDFVETVHVGEWVGSIERQLEVITAIKEALARYSPQRTWVGLTDEEFDDLRDNNFGVSPLISAVEAKLKERNT